MEEIFKHEQAQAEQNGLESMRVGWAPISRVDYIH